MLNNSSATNTFIHLCKLAQMNFESRIFNNWIKYAASSLCSILPDCPLPSSKQHQVGFTRVGGFAWIICSWFTFAAVKWSTTQLCTQTNPYVLTQKCPLKKAVIHLRFLDQQKMQWFLYKSCENGVFRNGFSKLRVLCVSLGRVACMVPAAWWGWATPSASWGSASKWVSPNCLYVFFLCLRSKTGTRATNGSGCMTF